MCDDVNALHLASTILGPLYFWLVHKLFLDYDNVKALQAMQVRLDHLHQ